ncbi:hypothetical protein LEMLEM_LOCUS23008, partial [Lemmus lemmus]
KKKGRKEEKREKTEKGKGEKRHLRKYILDNCVTSTCTHTDLCAHIYVHAHAQVDTVFQNTKDGHMCLSLHYFLGLQGSPLERGWITHHGEGR